MKYEDILKENTEILRRFEAQGTDLTKKYKIVFDLELESFDAVNRARELLKSNKHRYPSKDTVVINSTGLENYSLHLRLEKQRPTVEDISRTEEILLEIGHELGEHEVFWEFEVPARN